LFSSHVAAVTEKPEEKAEAPIVVILPQPQTVENGQSVTLTCQFDSAVTPQVTWMKEDKVIVDTEHRYEVRLLHQPVRMYTSTMAIHQVELGDAGNYRVIIKNKYGETTANVSLVVKGMSYIVIRAIVRVRLRVK
jgi:hypothetical protein